MLCISIEKYQCIDVWILDINNYHSFLHVLQNIFPQQANKKKQTICLFSLPVAMIICLRILSKPSLLTAISISSEQLPLKVYRAMSHHTNVAQMAIFGLLSCSIKPTDPCEYCCYHLSFVMQPALSTIFNRMEATDPTAKIIAPVESVSCFSTTNMMMRIRSSFN